MDTKKQHLHYILVADKSGSMAHEIDEVRKEINLQVEKIKEESSEELTCTFSFRTFCTGIQNVYLNTPIEEIKPITEKEYSVGGMTSLYDAIGSTLQGVGELLEDRIDGVNERVLITFFSDGGENSSSQYDANTVKRLLNKYQNKPGYLISFMGCDPASFRDISRANFNLDNSISYSKKSEHLAFRKMTDNIDAYRKGHINKLRYK